jgi:two-component system nitrate/nitrite response regulator NarL
MSRGRTPAPIVATFAGIGLTERDLQLLRAVASGVESDKALAKALICSTGTINDAWAKLFARLGLRSRLAAAVWAVRNGVA